MAYLVLDAARNNLIHIIDVFINPVDVTGTGDKKAIHGQGGIFNFSAFFLCLRVETAAGTRSSSFMS